jgi:hypothetical protein
MDPYHLTYFVNGFIRKISEDNVTDDTWILTDQDTKSPVVLIDGREHLLKPGWVASDGMIYGEAFPRSTGPFKRNVHVLYAQLPNTSSKRRSMSMENGRQFKIEYNETMTQIKCDGNNQHDWKTYNSGFSEYQYCSVCGRKAQ